LGSARAAAEFYILEAAMLGSAGPRSAAGAQTVVPERGRHVAARTQSHLSRDHARRLERATGRVHAGVRVRCIGRRDPDDATDAFRVSYGSADALNARAGARG